MLNAILALMLTVDTDCDRIDRDCDPAPTIPTTLVSFNDPSDCRTTDCPDSASGGTRVES